MEIYLIRHTTPDILPGICYGQSDLDLADSFTKEYAILREKLPEKLDQVYSSPLFRCKELALELGFPITLDKRLKEYDFGDWEMLPWKDIPKGDMEEWMKDFVSVAPPNGESYHALFQRVESFWDELLQNDPDEVIALTIHGGVIRSLLALLLEIPLKNAFRLHLDYGSICKVTFEKGLPLVHYINR